jgi:hypothetical protein
MTASCSREIPVLEPVRLIPAFSGKDTIFAFLRITPEDTGNEGSQPTKIIPVDVLFFLAGLPG